jgi:hypothetical protein
MYAFETESYLTLLTDGLQARLERPERWRTHMRGLKQIIELRGGISTLRTSHELLIALLWSV